ncbi:HlyD family efflux transporter periplasmic adaptor subunit [Cerasicoccus maritimus]|uniref:HlyD family efflux transporter periplasmic adaptor subunit n=1 Tax=Cerasicoccus maritimus TaxID=490089 RepID=UPI002852C0EA|nr:HlyD family efflux transporter periplasmic adaptor subunit [Cerasicoccus maritimus]
MFLLFLRFKQNRLWNFFLTASLFLAAANGVSAEFVAAQGLIKPQGGLIHVAAPAGQTGQAIIQELKVKNGDEVKQGQTLAFLANRPAMQADLSAAEKQAASAQAAVAIIEAQLDGIDAQVKAAEAEVAAAESQLSRVNAAVAQAQAGVNQAQKARLEALAKLDAAQSKISGTNAAYQNTLDELDPPRRETEEIKFQQKLLGEEERELSASRPATSARLDAEVTSAEAAVAVAQAEAESINAQAASAKANIATIENQRAVLQAELKRAQAAAEAAEAGVAQARAYLDMTEVLAPSDGVILRLGARAGEVVGPAGVVAMGDLSTLVVEAEVYIDDARKVKVGQTATLKSDAFKEQLQGKVIEVGQLVNPQSVFSNDPLEFSDKRVVIARIQIEPTSGWAPPIDSQVIARIEVTSAQ